jgi:integrase
MSEPKRPLRRARRRGGIYRVAGRNGDTFKIKIDLPELRRADGRRPTIVKTFKSYEQADAELRRLQEQAHQGVKVFERQTLAEWIACWLKDTIAAQIGAKSYERYSELLMRHVVPTLGKTQLRKVRTEEIERLYHHLAHAANPRRTGGAAIGLSIATITYVHRVLSQCLKDAVRLGRIGMNPAATVRRPKIGKNVPAQVMPKMTVLSREDLAKFLDGMRARKSKNMPYALVLLALDSGARRGELLALRWSDVNFGTRNIRISRAIDETKSLGVQIKDAPKNDASRREVTISGATVEQLRAELARQEADQRKLGLKLSGDALVFPESPTDPTAPMRPRHVSQEFARARKALGLPGFRFHDLRHNCASHMLAAGRPVPEVARHLGHATPAITMKVYAHAVPQRSAGTGMLDALLGVK